MNNFLFDYNNDFVEELNIQTKVLIRNIFGYHRRDQLQAHTLVHVENDPTIPRFEMRPIKKTPLKGRLFVYLRQETALHIVLCQKACQSCLMQISSSRNLA
ncbi:hypothetical protein SAMN05421758_1187 [Salimicrobium salexigens]|uniref:Transposase n=2 Tax=Salimicrobium salexigens TaxID=908941 RepID=A0ABY1L038_9BACI|nr:hypothetical protein SAMN05421758_1187 [Salimicrobium salexigens]